MSSRPLVLAVLTVLFCVSQAAAQGIPGSRGYVQGQAGWDAIREGRHQDAAEAFAAALMPSRAIRRSTSAPGWPPTSSGRSQRRSNRSNGR